MLVGFPYRGDTGSYWFTSFRSEKLAFYVLAGRIGEIGLLLSVWDIDGPDRLDGMGVVWKDWR